MVANVGVETNGAIDDTEEGSSPLKRLYLATLGAGIVIREEGPKLFEYLVERGAPLEEPVRQHRANARKRIEHDVERAGKAVNRAAGRVVRRYSGPKVKDVEDLSAEVDDLEKRAERL